MNFYVFSFDACRAFSVSFFRCHVFCACITLRTFRGKETKKRTTFFYSVRFSEETKKQ